MTEPDIYLDYAATSPVDPRVAAAMARCLGSDGVFANPASSHRLGRHARDLVERARAQIAARVGASPADIVFTSGATEANNLALQGMLSRQARAARRIVLTRIEHKSVLATAKMLAGPDGRLRYLDTDANGRVCLAQLEACLAEEPTSLVAIMHVNNEIGTLQDIEAIARCCRAAGVPLHVDAAQSVGKVPLELRDWGVDLCALTAHKICGPKGIGALFVGPNTDLAAMVHGGEQERGMRAGTLPTHQIVGMGEAYALADPDVDGARIVELSRRFCERVCAIPGVVRNGSAQCCIPHIVNLRFPGVDGESLRHALQTVAASAGSACNSDVPEPSYVLKSLGLSDALAVSSMRFSLGRFTTVAQVDAAAVRIEAAVAHLRGLAPSAPDWCRA